MPASSLSKLTRELSHTSLATLSPAPPLPPTVSSESEGGTEKKVDNITKDKKKKNKNVKDLFFQKFAEHGFSATDIPRAIVIHEAMGIFMLALTWSLCYLFPLSQHPFLRHPIERIMNTMPKGLSSSIASNGFINSRFGSSYIESSCLRKLIRPATLPTKVFLTFKFVELLHRFDSIPVSIITNISDQPTTTSPQASQGKITTLFSSSGVHDEEIGSRPKISNINAGKLFWKKGFLNTHRSPSLSLFDRFDAEMGASSNDNTLECLYEIGNSNVENFPSSSSIYSNNNLF